MSFNKKGDLFVTMSSDRKVRVFTFATGKLYRVYDETLAVQSEMQQAGTAFVKLESMDFGRRLAVERELDKSDYKEAANAVFDDSGNFILYATLLGIKGTKKGREKSGKSWGKEGKSAKNDMKSAKMSQKCHFCHNFATLYHQFALSNTLSSCEYSHEQGRVNTRLPRILSALPQRRPLPRRPPLQDRPDPRAPFCLFFAVFLPSFFSNNFLQEMAASDNPNLRNAEEADPTLFCSSFKRNRFFMITRRDPGDAEEEGAGGNRDVFNEKPTREEQTLVTETVKKEVMTTAVIYTTAGDITVKLFPESAPLAVENFITHARNGYYNNHIFHRVIRGFMIQTGDPFGAYWHVTFVGTNLD